MDLNKLAQEIRDILSERQKDFQLTIEEDNHKYTMMDLDGKLRSDFPSVSKVMKLFYDEFRDGNVKIEEIDGIKIMDIQNNK